MSWPRGWRPLSARNELDGVLFLRFFLLPLVFLVPSIHKHGLASRSRSCPAIIPRSWVANQPTCLPFVRRPSVAFHFHPLCNHTQSSPSLLRFAFPFQGFLNTSFFILHSSRLCVCRTVDRLSGLLTLCFSLFFSSPSPPHIYFIDYPPSSILYRSLSKISTHASPIFARADATAE